MKNLYVAAGSDPNIVNSLYSFDKNINSKAWNTLSSAKRKDEGSYNSLFNSTICEEAEKFIEAIDFKGKGSLVLESLLQFMPFVKNLRINNASEEQINKIIGSRDRNLINIKVNSH